MDYWQEDGPATERPVRPVTAPTTPPPSGGARFMIENEGADAR